MQKPQGCWKMQVLTPKTSANMKGVALKRMGNPSAARELFRQATIGNSQPAQAIFYNDPQPDKILYQGLAWMELGEKERAAEIFRTLIEFGKSHMDDTISIDYFAVSLPELLVFDVDLDQRNRIHCLYLVALGRLGLAMLDKQNAGDLFEKLLQLDLNHQGALLHAGLQSDLLTTEKIIVK
jgi:tetratricopeptide (TPR) repeat protein